ncbi:DUF1345 domain-containing protein [Sphingomonas ginsenosidivorax]|uniref:DUF1345 domain-containing protein n=1 Tax=Sphingomonas ginsenosidivorax TaxID=862135 RepID=A0A5C6UIH4_9SPHN|nr:DUF1345 domain-containing protein [Sphingomonas ginsenosidivorax]TXC72026.1 DUF1345 domain-containing protein [Sphingomonas ginsenosidivorax]
MAGLYQSLGQRIAPPRFVLFVLVMLAGLGIAIPSIGVGRGTMVAFDVAALVFLIAVSTLLRSEADGMRKAAAANDANRALLLALSVTVSIVVLVAVAKEVQGKNDTLSTVLVIATLALAWLFSNTVYALHYAHFYYLGDGKGEDRGGIEIPKCDEPDYWDFLYFSFTLGMTFQTSDVQITSAYVRRVVTGQSLAAFVFNLGVIAFTINVLGGG